MLPLLQHNNVSSSSSNSENRFFLEHFRSNPYSFLQDNLKSYTFSVFAIPIILFMFLNFIFVPHLEILVMLCFLSILDLNPTYLGLVVLQIQLPTFSIATQNPQFLTLLLLLNLLSQFLQQIAIMFFMQYFCSLNLITHLLIQNPYILSLPLRCS